MKKKYIQFCLNLDKETKDKLIMLADRNRISQAQQIRNLILDAELDKKSKRK